MPPPILHPCLLAAHYEFVPDDPDEFQSWAAAKNGYATGDRAHIPYPHKPGLWQFIPVTRGNCLLYLNGRPIAETTLDGALLDAYLLGNEAAGIEVFNHTALFATPEPQPQPRQQNQAAPPSSRPRHNRCPLDIAADCEYPYCYHIGACRHAARTSTAVSRPNPNQMVITGDTETIDRIYAGLTPTLAQIAADAPALTDDLNDLDDAVIYYIDQAEAAGPLARQSQTAQANNDSETASQLATAASTAWTLAANHYHTITGHAWTHPTANDKEE